MTGSSRTKREKHEKPTAAGDASGNATQSQNTGFLQKIRSFTGSNKLDDMNAWEIFTKHPLIHVGKFILIPYLIYLSRFYVQLQHPEYISKMTGGIINLRPAIYGTNISRQVLIVATPGSGTVQMSSELRNKLSLEIGHESTDAAWDFTRDGSISWFHGIRFFSQPKDNNEKIRSIAKICNSDIETHSNMGFHPAMYGPPMNKCSYRSKWNECWKSECYIMLLKEWGCGITNTCEINFEKNIHQVRNPMKTLESLVVKYCIGGLEGVTAAPFLTYASALFPSHDFHEDSCIEATGTFLFMYLQQMLTARSKGHIDSYYRIEKSSACDVAEAAGLLSSNTTVYEPNHIRINRLCDKSNTKLKSPAQNIVEQKLNKVNKDQVRLGWKDLRGGMHGSKRKDGDRILEGRIKNMFLAFIYDQMTIPLQYKTVDDHSEL
ncbi:hypothetical protein ACHAXR_007981 [Thalassiosira sp. AJA248-18]